MESITNASAALPAVAVEEYKPVTVSIKSLLEAGAHYGHKTDKWNPKMLPYIFAERNGVHIINLDLTLQFWEKARKFILDVTSRGGLVLFVGTKQQAFGMVKQAAERCGAFYINNRWLGGTLSNFETIRNSINRMKKMEELLIEAEKKDTKIRIGKKERLSISKQVSKLAVNLGGIRDMKKVPDLIFVVDINKEDIAVSESRRLRVPVVALVDTNTDPNLVSFPIPANDDAARTLALFINAVADAVIEGREAFRIRMSEADKANAARQAQNRALAEKQEGAAPAA